ncbi:MAG: hypothetical protein ACYDH5_06850 [Acidimicrobiales bacterium]
MSEVRIARAKASSTRSTLDLLWLPWPFSQLQLLTADEFVKKAEEQVRGRGWRLDVGALEELHRTGVLVPFFRVRLGDPDPDERIDVAGSLTRRHVTSTVESELFRAAVDGRATDPGTEPFSPWPREQRQYLWPSNDWAFVYSHHQLHCLRRTKAIVTQLERSVTPKAPITWGLPSSALPSQDTLDEIARWRGLAIVLSALDTIYWPEIMRTVSYDLRIWREVRAAFDATATLDWLGVSLTEVAEQADDFRFAATFGDVLGDFFDVVRRAKPSAWVTLRGPALVAMEDRIAAEILHRTAEEISPTAPAPGGTLPAPLSQQWLGDRPRSLDASLSNLLLSPHPTVVLALEGETEMLLMRRAFELLGIRDDPNFIRIECFGGTKKDLQLLARFAAAPLLGADRGNLVELDRPLTHFLVLTDAENKYATGPDRRKQRLLLLDSITYAVPKDLRADYYGRSAHVVEIRTWGRLPFEFAHFSDTQLASTLIGESTRTFPGGQAALEGTLNRERRSSSPNVKDAWPSSGMSKVDLAHAMWPLIERRMKVAISRGAKGPPIMAGALRAYELALRYYRQSVALRRRRWRPPRG